MVRLTNDDVKWLVKRVSSGNFKIKKASQIYRVPERRVQQLIKNYRDTWVVPILNPKRRPKTYLRDKQKDIIDNVWKET